MRVMSVCVTFPSPCLAKMLNVCLLSQRLHNFFIRGILSSFSIITFKKNFFPLLYSLYVKPIDIPFLSFILGFLPFIHNFNFCLLDLHFERKSCASILVCSFTVQLLSVCVLFLIFPIKHLFPIFFLSCPPIASSLFKQLMLLLLKVTIPS